METPSIRRLNDPAECSLPKQLKVAHPALEVVIEAAFKAGKIQRAAFRRPVLKEAKSPANFVSEVDLQCEATIVGCLREAFPTDEILAEEGQHTSAKSHRLWVIDPLDGTSNFLHGLPQFAVSIALVIDEVAQLGVIYNPMHDDWYYAVRGQGAWWNGALIQASQESKLSESLIAVGFYYDRGQMMEATLAAIGDLFRHNIHGVRRLGAAALDISQVARGDFGCFFEFMLQPWDHAASGLILEEAGGKITDCNNQPLSYRKPSSVLASNSLLHPAIIDVIEKYYDRSRPSS
jgi:myo-inositol-1(or 4)-monophosphatase